MADSSAETPSYYPPGWNYERVLNADQSEFLSWDPETFGAFHEGLKADLGFERYKDFLFECQRRELLRNGDPTPSEPTIPQVPNFWRVLNQFYPPNSEWGFVVFRTVYSDDKSPWTRFRERWDEIIGATFDFYGALPEVQAVRQKLRFQWVEDPELQDAPPAEIARRYRQMQLQPGLDHSLCLCVTAASLDSVLNAPFPSDIPLTERPQLAYVRAVDTNLGADQGNDEGEDDRRRFRGYFNVALETLLDEIFPVIANQSLESHEIGAKITSDDQVWCFPASFGIYSITREGEAQPSTEA